MDALINGVRLFWQPVGPADNYPLFVLHGGGLDHTYLRPCFDALSARFRVLYVDLRGHGRSERGVPAPASLPVLAADVSKLAALLGVTHYAVMGHSFGAFVALSHAIEEGTASHYVLAHGSASGTKTDAEIATNLATFEPAALRDQLTRGWALEAAATTAEDVAEAVRMGLPLHFAHVDSAAYRAFVAPDGGLAHTLWPEDTAMLNVALEYEDVLSTIQQPVLVVGGEYDRICTPRASCEMHAGIPGSDLVILPGVGHMGMAERPDLYLATLHSFFERHPLAT